MGRSLMEHRLEARVVLQTDRDDEAVRLAEQRASVAKRLPAIPFTSAVVQRAEAREFFALGSEWWTWHPEAVKIAPSIP